MKLNCLITDDEPIAQEIIEGYVKMLPELHLVGTCSNAIETLSAIRNNHVDLLLIDIQMPEINGIDLIRSLHKVPMVIFTTAYPSFAIDGFELDAVDYLLKPVSLERFLKSIEKVYARMRRGKQPMETSAEKTMIARTFFFIKSDSGLTRIDYQEILYIEGLENYIKIVCESRTVISLHTMKAIESVLPVENFLRIHRSYIVNMNKVERVKDYFFRIRNVSLQTGKSYRKSIQAILRMRFSIQAE